MPAGGMMAQPGMMPMVQPGMMMQPGMQPMAQPMAQPAGGGGGGYQSLIMPMQDFVPSDTFQGPRDGMTFKTGPKGTGYYKEMTTDQAAARMQAAFRANQAREEVNIKKKVEANIKKPALQKRESMEGVTDLDEGGSEYKTVEEYFLNSLGDNQVSKQPSNSSRSKQHITTHAFPSLLSLRRGATPRSSRSKRLRSRRTRRRSSSTSSR